MDEPDLDELTGLEGEESGPGLTPMLDMVFILLIFLMVSIQFSDPVQTFQVDLPRSRTSIQSQEGPGPLLLEIRRDGVILYSSTPVVPGDPVWEATFSRERCGKEPITLMVDRKTPFEIFSRVAVDLRSRGCEAVSIGMLEEK